MNQTPVAQAVAQRIIIVPVSGGKDSQVVLSLAKKHVAKTGQTLLCVHQWTGWDHPFTMEQITAMETYYGVSIMFTKNEKFPRGMLDYLDSAKYFPSSGARGCTERLKQQPFAAWLVAYGFNATNCEIWFGMRSDESAERADKYGGLTPEDEFTLADVGKYYGSNQTMAQSIGLIPVRLPIVNMTTEGVFSYIADEGAPLNKLYARGHHRVGCYPCQLARKAEWVAVGKDPVGQEHLRELIGRENEWHRNGNKRKLIKVHAVWDVREFLPDGDPGRLRELASEECGYCSI